MWDYTDTVKEHFWKPRNVGELKILTVLGKLVPLPVATRSVLRSDWMKTKESKKQNSKALAVPVLLRRHRS